MQILHHELEPERVAPPSGRPSLRARQADQAAAHTEEVRMLRQRIALLEAQLVSTQATPESQDAAPSATPPPLTSIDFAQPVSKTVTSSEFTASLEPAVVAVSAGATAGPLTATTANPSPGFAQAWAEQDDVAASFEDRIAEKAFFQGTSVDEESRNWLLEN